MATIVASAAGGNWNATTTWVGGVVPNAGSDVQLNATSGNVAINVASSCQSLDCTGYTGTLSHAAVILQIGSSIAGAGNIALKFVAGMTYTVADPYTPELYFTSSSSTQQTISSGGVPFGKWSIRFGNYILADAVNQNTGQAAFELASGTLDTNNQNVTWGYFYCGSGSAKTFTAGTSNITLLGSTFDISGTNTTITPNSANVVMNSGFPTVRSGNNDLKGMSMSLNISSVTYYGNGIFNNFSMTGNYLTMGGNITVTGVFTAAGFSGANRLFVSGSVANTLINAAAVSLNRVDFRNITGAGAAAPFTGSSVGDCGGNSGITFTPAVTRYAVAAGNWSNTAIWSSSSGGAPGATVPLPQDTVIFNSSSGGGVVNLDMLRLGGDLNFTGYTGAIQGASDVTSYGSITVSSSVFWSTPYRWNLQGRGTHTITTAGKVFGHVDMDAPGGTYTLQDNLTAGNFNINAGTLVTQSKTVTVNILISQPVAATINIGNSIINLKTTNSETIFNNYYGVALAGAATINILNATSNSRDMLIAGSGLANTTINYVVAGSTGSLLINASNATIGNLNFSDASNARTLTLASTGPTTFTGTFNVKGTPGKLMSIRSLSAGTPAVLSKATGTVSADYLSLQDSTATGGAKWYAGANSVNLSNNTGWVFSAPPASSGFMFLFE